MVVDDEKNNLSKKLAEKWKRIRFVKKILRYMPRRASIGKYPVLNKFADTAKKRAYLWSFRVTEVIPAFYTGWIITFMPIPSILQIMVAFFIALICRANAMILVCLQLLSNAITFPFMWFVTHKVGSFVVDLLGTSEARSVHMPSMGEFISMIKRHDASELSQIGKLFLTVSIPTIVLGALFLGTAVGFICSLIYKIMSKKYSKD